MSVETLGLRVLVLAVLTALLLCQSVAALKRAAPTSKKTDDTECSSLSGPFCALTGSLGLFEPYMTPISLLDLEGSEVSRRPIKADEGVAPWQRKRCFFQHYAGSWMDAGGNDIMNQPVANVDECEQLCCVHPRCASFTFWRSRICFLRAASQSPRHDDDSFSGIRLA